MLSSVKKFSLMAALFMWSQFALAQSGTVNIATIPDGAKTLISVILALMVVYQILTRWQDILSGNNIGQNILAILGWGGLALWWYNLYTTAISVFQG